MEELGITIVELFDIDDGSRLGMYYLKPGTIQVDRQELSDKLREERVRISFLEKVRPVSLKWLLDTYGD